MSIDRKNKTDYTYSILYVFGGCPQIMGKKRGRMNLQRTACLMVVLGLLGFIISFQMKSVAQDRKDTKDGLEKQISAYQDKIAELEQQIKENTAENEELQDKYNNSMQDLYAKNPQFYEMYKKYESDVEESKFYAGLTTVTGPGILIALDDEQKTGDKPYVSIIHDIYLNETVNILRAAGAQAISINDERIVSMSETFCIGPSIRVNGTKLFPPYRIQAVGDPQKLSTAFKNSSIYKTMITLNLTIASETKDAITIEKYNKSYEKSLDLLQKLK